MTPDVVELVRQFAARLGVAVEYVWPLLVAYTRWLNTVWLAVDVVWALGALLAVPACARRFREHVYLYNHRADERYQGYEAHAWLGALNLFGAVVLTVGTLMAITALPVHFASMVAPEAAMLLDLVKRAGGK